MSFAERHNEANGEDNRDGHTHNYSENHGVEGPTNDPAIRAIRRRHRLNLLATLLFSQGTPMLLAGDEFGNSQSGNNNAYAQDNEIGWLDWSGRKRDPAFFDEVCRIVRTRRELSLLHQAEYRHTRPSKATGRANVEWFDAGGQPIAEADWPSVQVLGLLLSRPDDVPAAREPVQAVSILFNAGNDDCAFELPAIASPGAWVCRYSSAAGGPAEISRGRIRVEGFSIACLSYESSDY